MRRARLAALALFTAAGLGPLSGPAQAWEVQTGLICVLTHRTATVDLRMTYDPAVPEYSITLQRLGAAWPVAGFFAIRFDGPRGLTISTNRHVLAQGGAALTVRDSGFSNVLDGLEFNRTATAHSGETSETIDLDGAAPAIRAFRDCTAAPSA